MTCQSSLAAARAVAPTHVWIGRKPCGHAVYVANDTPDNATDIGRHVARLIRDGRRVDRITFDEYKALGQIWICTCPVTPEEQKLLDREMRRADATAKKRLGGRR